MSGSPDWKPNRRYKASASEWRQLRELKEGMCRVCRKQWGTNLHHLVGKGVGGDDVADNLVPLCGLGNAAGCHGLIHAQDETACVKLGASLTTNERGYVIAKKGAYFLADRYRVSQRLGNYFVTGLEAA